MLELLFYFTFFEDDNRPQLSDEDRRRRKGEQKISGTAFKRDYDIN